MKILQVSLKDIEEFEKEYKGSDEEKEDIKKAYLGNSIIFQYK